MYRKFILFNVLLAGIIAGYFYHAHLARQVSPPAPPPMIQTQPGPAVQAPLAQKPPEIHDGRLLAKLPNGLTVLIQEDRRFQLVSERLYVRAGSSYEKPGQEEGISHLLEHMVFNSTRTRPKGEVARDIEAAGGSINASTSFDHTVFTADLPAEHWRLGLEVFKDMTFGAKFLPEELEQEKNVVIAELKKNLDEPDDRLFQMDQEQIWAGKPYQHPVIGFEDTVRKVTSEDLRRYLSRLYQPQSMLLVLVGDVDAGQVYQEVSQIYGGLANDQTVSPPVVDDLPPGTQGPAGRGLALSVNKCRLHLAFATSGLYSDQDTPLDVLADLLGGGRTSRLYRKFRYDLQLVDDISVDSTTLERGGMLVVDATLDQAKLTEFWPLLVKELAGLRASDFTDQEMARAKLNIEDGIYRAKETLRGLAMKLGYYQFYGFGPDGEANDIYQVRHLDRGQLEGLIARYMTPANACLSVLVPGQDQAQADQAARDMLKVLKDSWPGQVQAQPAPQAQALAGPAQPEVVDLGQGRQVVLLADQTLPYASLTLTYQGGDRLLSPDQQGLGELAARALTRSTAKRSAEDLEDFLADRAASLQAAGGRDSFTLSAHYPARFAGDVLGAFAQVVTQPAFAPKDFDLARQAQLAQIAESQDQPLGLAFRNLFPFLYAAGPYSYLRTGEPAQVAGFTPQAARAYWDKQSKLPWVLAVCGTFDRGQILDLAKTLAQAPTEPGPDFTVPAWGQDRVKDLTLAGRNQTHLFWVFPVPGETDPDTPALEVLKAALAGQGGTLFSELRDKQGLGYTVTAFLWQAPKTGFLAFYIGTYPDKAAQAQAGFKDVAARLAKSGLGAEELDRAKSVMQGQYFRDHQSLASRGQEAAVNLAMGYGLDWDRELLAKADKLNAQDIQAVAAKYLDPDKAYLLKVTP